jgi:hypothetical protein
VYDLINKLVRKQAEVIDNHLNGNVWAIKQSEATPLLYKMLKI